MIRIAKVYTFVEIVGLFRGHIRKGCRHDSSITSRFLCTYGIQRTDGNFYVTGRERTFKNTHCNFLKVSSCHGNVLSVFSDFNSGCNSNPYVQGMQCVRGLATRKGGRSDLKSYKDLIDYDSSKEFSDDDDDNYDTVKDDEEDDTGGEIKTWKDVTHSVSGFRADQLLAAGLAISRKQVEDAFLAGKLRLNGAKLIKKSKKVELNDTVDIIKSRQGNEEGTIAVMRIILKNINDEKTNKGNHVVTLRRWKHLSIPKLKK